MFIGNPLAVALGGVSTANEQDGDVVRKQLVRAGEAMVKAGLAIVLNKAGTKQPMCTLTGPERKHVDQAAIDAAASKGDPNAERRRHTCGLTHAISDIKDASRILPRLARRERFNIGVHCGRSRVLVVDLDTSGQVKKFLLRCGEQRPGLTVRSPGSRDASGNWAHKDGGHVWFDVPEGVELPTSTGIYKDSDAGWVAMWGDHQVLVPPSIRPEGPYALVGSTHPMPDWLLETITEASQVVADRREESQRRREERRERGGTSEIDEWATRTPWSEILLPDGWVETTLIDQCGCPIWTAPGLHGSPKSATAHEPGCETYSCEVGHGPLHVWTDNPSEAVDAAVQSYGKRTLTKLHVITWTQGAGNMSRTCDELGIERPGPTVISSPLDRWETGEYPEQAVDRTAKAPSAPAEPAQRVDRSSVATDRDDSDERDDFALIDDEDDADSDSVDEINEHSPRKVEEPSFDEKMITREYQRIHWQESARRRYEEARTPPLQKWDVDQFLDAPRPDPLVPGMLYRDSLSRMFGAPGGGKSFLAMDIALSIACGLFWNGTKLSQEKVVYVMAEGQRVNGDRVEAWLSKNRRNRDDLRGWFHAVPEAVKLTETSVRELAEWVRDLGAGLVVLDTKNAMMVGEENSASDFAEMRRALDILRTASGCCVLLIDHTGHEGTRARGSSAGTAAMDTEIRVLKDDESKPALVLAEVTRDKAGEAGTEWAWRLVPEHPAAVLETTEVPTVSEAMETWLRAHTELPESVERYEGPGSKAVVDLARLMLFQTMPRHDRSQLGITLAEARKELKEKLDHDPMTVKRAWSALKDMGYIASVYEEPTPIQEQTGAHVWSGPITMAPDPRNGDQK